MQEFLQEFGVEHWLAVGSALLALGSFILNLRLVDRQEKRDAVAVKMAHDSDIIRWSDEVIARLAEAQELLAEKGISFNDADFRPRRSAMRAELSALIDRGRLFFPNRADPLHGQEKEAGFQGYRQPILDALVASYDLLSGAGSAPGPDAAACQGLRTHSRAFISELYKAVDPIRRGEKVKELTS
jgi:hypothetical protein